MQNMLMIEPKKVTSTCFAGQPASCVSPLTVSGRITSTPIPSISSDSRCANCGKTAAVTGLVQLLRCSKCKSVAYCGAACQRVHWKAGGHKAACKKIWNMHQQQQQQSAAADE